MSRSTPATCRYCMYDMHFAAINLKVAPELDQQQVLL